MGRLEEGLEVALDCALLAGDLAQDEPDTFYPVLAKTLHSISTFHSRLGQREEALRAERECVALYRDLAQDEFGHIFRT